MISDVESAERGGLRSAPSAADMVGIRYQFRDFYEVGREKVREYARSVQDYHPVHWDEEAAAELGYPNLVAPLTFISLVGLGKMFEEVDVGYDLNQVLHTDQVIEYHRPILVGDRLTCDFCVDSFRQMAGTDIIGLKAMTYNQHGELVQTAVTTVVVHAALEVDSGMSEAVKGIMMHPQML